MSENFVFLGNAEMPITRDRSETTVSRENIVGIFLSEIITSVVTKAVYRVFNNDCTPLHSQNQQNISKTFSILQ